MNQQRPSAVDAECAERLGRFAHITVTGEQQKYAAVGGFDKIGSGLNRPTEMQRAVLVWSRKIRW